MCANSQLSIVTLDVFENLTVKAEINGAPLSLANAYLHQSERLSSIGCLRLRSKQS